MLQVDEIDCPGGPVASAEILREDSHFCFLDSSLAGSLGRWSFIAARPRAVLTVEHGRARVDGHEVGGDALDVLQSMLDENRLRDDIEAPPFAAGAAGYISYDFGRYLEPVPSLATEDLSQPDMCFAFYDCTAAFDIESGRLWLCYLPSGKDKAEEMRHALRSSATPQLKQDPCYPPGRPTDWTWIDSNFTPDAYLKAVERVKDYIAAGDVYQINLSQRFSTPFQEDPWELYKVLRRVNPSPFGCFLNFPELVLASASPERLLHLDGASRVVETRPIKGTRRRGRDRDEDVLLAAELKASPKDRAENVMIVDMERNDLGKVCDYGSVHVPDLWAIEEHPNVFQMVSTVRGRLAADRGPADLIRACFPGGSITGAPKVRAMQIIEEIEPVRRGIYTGSVGYIDFRGNMDLNIVIRSIFLRGGRAYFHGGGGIVADSVPEKEYQETLDKVSGLVSALAVVRGRGNR